MRRSSPSVAWWTGAPVLLAACVSAPEAKDWLAIGFRTPEQTFATFQTAVRADEPGLEYRCLSSQFVSSSGISNLTYREFREELRRKNPLLRKGIADAELESAPEIRGDRARLVVRSLGRRMRFELVREGYAQLWSQGELVADEPLPFQRATGAQHADDGSTWVYGRMRLPQGRQAEDVTEVRFASEWKIDGIESLGEASKSPGPMSPP
ncbi:MAG: hypothetical protein ACKVWV_13330 [Planctomycetota bacterium]